MIPQNPSAGLQPYRQYVEQEQQFPSEHEESHYCSGDSEHFAKCHAAAPGLEPACDQPKNIECGKAKHRSPQKVVHPAAGQHHLGHQDECFHSKSARVGHCASHDTLKTCPLRPSFLTLEIRYCSCIMQSY